MTKTKHRAWGKGREFNDFNATYKAATGVTFDEARADTMVIPAVVIENAVALCSPEYPPSVGVLDMPPAPDLEPCAHCQEEDFWATVRFTPPVGSDLVIPDACYRCWPSVLKAEERDGTSIGIEYRISEGVWI